MFKVSIKNISSQKITSEAEFESEALANEWLNHHTGIGSFGKAEHQREVTPATYDQETGAELTAAVYETVPSEYTVTITDITAEHEAEVLKQDKIAKGKAARQVCETVLDLISGYNLDRQLTLEQITEMQTIFANAEKALRSGRPTYAKNFIAAIEADGTLVTQDMKDTCLSLLSGY